MAGWQLCSARHVVYTSLADRQCFGYIGEHYGNREKKVRTWIVEQNGEHTPAGSVHAQTGKLRVQSLDAVRPKGMKMGAAASLFGTWCFGGWTTAAAHCSLSRGDAEGQRCGTLEPELIVSWSKLKSNSMTRFTDTERISSWPFYLYCQVFVGGLSSPKQCCLCFIMK